MTLVQRVLVLANAVLLASIVLTALIPLRSAPQARLSHQSVILPDHSVREPAGPPVYSDAAKRLFGAPPSKPNAQIAPEKSNQPVALSFRLVGVILGPSSRSALVEQSGQVKRLTLGDELSGWRLEAIGDRSAGLNREGESLRLELDRTTCCRE